jgi:MFS family permease
MQTTKRPPLAVFIYFLIFIGYALRMSITPYMDSLRRDFSLSYSQTGLLFSAFMIGYIAFRLPAGVWADKYGSRPILMIGSALAGVAQLAILAFPNYGPMLASRIIAGVGAGVIYTASVRVLALEYQHTKRGLSMGILQSAVGAGTLFALVFPSLQPVQLRWQTAMLIYPVLSFLGVGVSWFLPTQPTATRDDHVQNVRNKSIEVVLISAIGFFQLFSLTAGLAWLPTYFGNRFTVTPSVSSLLSSFSSIILVFFAIFTGFLIDIWPASILLMGLGCIFTALGYLGLLANIGFGLAIVSLISLGLGLALFLPTLTYAAIDTLGPKRSGLSSGITGTAAQIGATLSGVVVGWLVDRTGQLSAAWAVCIVSSILALMFLIVLQFTTRRVKKLVNNNPGVLLE